MSIQRGSSHSPSPSSHWKYDVFLSFRGQDTRTNFTDHLYAALNQIGINVFKDDKELERGEAISPGLINAIQESRSSIIVFSRNYACSSWCLDELVQIIQCKNTNAQMIFPIFYDVEPTVVRKQTGTFQEAFAEHEEAFRHDTKKVETWRTALREVANLSGWELKDRSEVEFIQEIVDYISSRLRPETVSTLDNLAGINSRAKELERLVRGTEFEDVRMVGIWGMGGIGKTTIARVVYDTISYEFQGSTFLANVRETSENDGITILQKQLIVDLIRKDIKIHNDLDGVQMIKSKLRHKKVLIVIDDVSHIGQLNKLTGERSWFGSGSRIIITTRDERLLISRGVDVVYKAKALNDTEAFKLFCLKAFNNNLPPKEYVELTNHVIKFADGLPLALDVLGSFLSGRPADEWRSALKRLNRDFENEILGILQISFDGLKESEKKIFLDIACFFKRQDKDYVIKILEHCGFHAIIGISVLIEKSLITISNKNQLWMHDLLQEMGQQIVMRESPKEPGKWSRLWKTADVHHVLTKNTATEAVEAIVSSTRHLSASYKAFSKLTNLRLLIISGVQFPEGLEYLSNELRMLEWNGYPLKSLPSNSYLDKLIELNMCYSRMEHLWKGVKSFNKLKVMRLSHSRNLIRTPDFTEVPNLQELDLESCTALREIHPSLLTHKKLVFLNLKGCSSLTTLPGKIAMESLTTLVLSSCSKLKQFPEIVGTMGCLSELFLDGTLIEELPLSIELLTGLTLLNLENCTNLVRLPSTINGLTSLRTFNLSNCSKSKNESKSLAQAESLEELDLTGSATTKPLSSIFHVKNVKEIFLSKCKGPLSWTSWYSWFPFSIMQRRSSDPMALTLPSLSGLCCLTKLDLSGRNLGEGASLGDICSLFSLQELNLSKNNFVSLPETINRLSKLKHLKLKDCKRLESLPELPAGIRNVKIDGCGSLETLSVALRSCRLDFSLISGINCLKILGNIDLAFSMLKGFLEAWSNPSRFTIIVPASKIPEWFSYQKEGSSIIIRPSDLYNKNKLAGYVICCLFHVGSSQYSYGKRVRSSQYSYGRHVINFTMEVEKVESSTTSFNFKDKFGSHVSDHLLAFYLSREHYFEYKQTDFSFGVNQNAEIEVKRCGVHPVYVHQVEVFNQTSEATSSTIWNFDQCNQDSVGSTMAVATTSNRNLINYVGEEASESGSCSSEEEEPQVKRSRKLEFSW